MKEVRNRLSMASLMALNILLSDIWDTFYARHCIIVARFIASLAISNRGEDTERLFDVPILILTDRILLTCEELSSLSSSIVGPSLRLFNNDTA